MKRYIIQKVLNNNIVQCQIASQDEECMLLGKGIGFQKTRGDMVDPSLIEKAYFTKDQKNITRYLELVEMCDSSVVDVVEEVIQMMERHFGNVYDEYLHIALLDHLNFSIYRYKNHIDIKNIFLEEFSIMYEKEYSFAKEMLRYINECLDVHLPDSEIGFITLHIHSALHDENVSKSALYMQIIATCIEHIENALDVHLDACSIERMRLITHLKFALERADKKVEINNPILDTLKITYPKTYALALSLGDMMKDIYGVKLHEGEIGYLALHIQNIVLSLDD